MNRAYSVLTVKSFDDDARTFSGIASTPTTDRQGDIVEPKGAEYTLPIPLLWQHRSSEPVGSITHATITSSGIQVRGQFAKVDEPPSLKEDLDRAWSMIKAKLVRGLSIGFSPIEYAMIKETGGTRFTKWSWLELSAVTIPANAEASIQTIKSIDQQQRAASGRSRLETPPGASGKPTGHLAHFTNRSPKGDDMKTIHEEISDLNEQRSIPATRMKEIGDLWETPGHLKSDSEREEFDSCAASTEEFDDKIRVKQIHALNISKAKPVSDTDGGRRSSGQIIVKGSDKEEKFKGQNYTRMVIAKALSHLDEYHRSPATIAEERWGKTNPTLVAIIKANEVPGGGTGSGEWGRELVAADNRYTGDFLEYLYGMTVFDKLPLREIPANVAIKGQDGAATGYWVGESKAIPNTTVDFSSVNLTPLKVAALAVCSNELLRDSSPAAEGLIRDALVEASAQRIDLTFLSATAASAGVSPAGILNGVSATPASGTDAAAMRADLQAVLATFDAAKDSGGIQIVTTRALARSIAMMYNALGTAQDFPGATPNGGSWLTYPVVVGDNVPSGDIIVLNPREIYKIGDLGVTVSISRDAMIEQSSAPTGATDTPVAASQVFTSMFQEESTAIKVVRPINFAKRRTTAVAFISGAAYGSTGS